jgi:parallel beta-helix repeat protein
MLDPRNRRSPIAIPEPGVPAICILLMALVLAGCEAGATDVVSPSSVRVTAPTLSVEQKETLQLVAEVQPASASQAVTWSTSDPTRATVSAAGLVTGGDVGPVTITATSTANPALSDAVQLNVMCQVLTQADVASGAVLTPDVCYHANSPLSVSGGTLVIRPGVRIEFASNAHLTIGSGGRLNAIGTAEAPIYFTTPDAAGTWRGINFNGSRSADNVLHHVNIENGGSAGWSGAAYSRSALLLQGSALVDIRNSTITGSRGQGITLYDGSEMTFEDNTLSNNALAAWVDPNTAGYVSGTTTFADNTKNVVQVAFDNTGAVSRAQTWQSLAVPYEIQHRIFVDAKLEVGAGAVIAFAAGTSMIVRNAGALTARGIAASITPGVDEDVFIYFTSAEPGIRGYWKGIQIATNSADNAFELVKFENGGSDPWTGDGDSRAMAYLTGDSRALIRYTEFDGSGGYGLWVSKGAALTIWHPVFSNNERPLIVHPDHLNELRECPRFYQNRDSRIFVGFDNTDAFTRDGSVGNYCPADLPPFYFAHRTYVQAAVRIFPDKVIEFGQDASLIVNNGGSLNIGTDNADNANRPPVIMRGAEDVDGYWKGIEFGTVSALNFIGTAEIHNAGSEAWFGGANSRGAINVTGDGSVELFHTTFAKSGGYAAIIASGGTISCDNVNHGGFLFFNRATNTASPICP